MYTKILELILTKEDITILRDEIALLKASLFQTNTQSFQDVLKKDVRRSISEAISSELATAKTAPKQYLEGLEAKIKDVNEIRIQLAFEPTNRSLEAIRAWLSKNVSGFVVIDLYYNPSVIGGAAISFNGKYYDGTIAKKLEQ